MNKDFEKEKLRLSIIVLCLALLFSNHPQEGWVRVTPFGFRLMLRSMLDNDVKGSID